MSGVNSKRAKLNANDVDLINTNTTTETDASSIQDLPDELLLAIFDNIPPEELVLTIPLVCQRWSDLHSHASLYEHLVFKHNLPDTTVAVELLTMAPRLKYLKMRSRSDTDELLHHVANCNPLLETLKLRSCRGTSQEFQVSPICLQQVMTYCSRLGRLSLRGTECESPEFFNEIGHHLPLLQAIDFGTSENCTDVELLNNADAFRKLSDLRIFTEFSDDVVTRFCENHFRSLTTVKLYIDGCSDASFIALAACQQLRTLYLDGADQVTDKGIMEISKLSHLEKLYISVANEVTAPCWTSFFETANMKQIKKLTLTYCKNVNYNVLIAIAQNLSDIRSLSFKLCENMSFKCHLKIYQMLPQHCDYEPLCGF